MRDWAIKDQTITPRDESDNKVSALEMEDIDERATRDTTDKASTTDDSEREAKRENLEISREI